WRPRLLRCGVRRHGRFRLLFLVHYTNETYALAGQSTDEALVLSCVVNRASHDIDAGAQCRFRDDPPVPDCGNQVVLADYPVPVFDQVFEEIENLRCDCNKLTPAT